MATPASASDPSHPMKYTSPVLTIAWAAITAIFGAARRSKVGRIGASRRLRVRAAIGLSGEVEIAGLIAHCPVVRGLTKQLDYKNNTYYHFCQDSISILSVPERVQYLETQSVRCALDGGTYAKAL